MKISKRLSLIAASAALVGFLPLSAQTVTDTSAPEATLNLPNGQKLYGSKNPNIRRASAKINGQIITETDINHRLALSLQANKQKLSDEQITQFRSQVLNSLIDETLQIQEAETQEMEVTKQDVDSYFNRISAQSYRKTPAETAIFLKSIGSSAESVKRQIKGELAWQRLVSRNVTPFIEVSDDEVTAIVDRINKNKGRVEYHPAEIYLSTTPENEAQIVENAKKILAELSKGASFVAYARQFSEASSASVGGDLGWLFPEQLPDTMAQSLNQMNPNEVKIVPTPGGLSILLLMDKRQVATADPRDSKLSLKQLSITFPAGSKEADILPQVKRFNEETAKIKGCGSADAVAKSLNAEIFNRDNLKVSELPAALQNVMLQLSIGQSSPPYGSIEEGVRVFVLCGLDAPPVASVSSDKIRRAAEDKKTDKRAQLLLRDLRRDAIIEYN